MRISDWSSDVCSSDLGGRKRGVERRDRLTVGIEFGGDGGKVEGRIGACEIGVDARFESLPRREQLAALGHFRPQVAVGCRCAFAFSHGERIVETRPRSEEHTSELQSLMRISYAVFCL